MKRQSLHYDNKNYLQYVKELSIVTNSNYTSIQDNLVKINKRKYIPITPISFLNYVTVTFNTSYKCFIIKKL